MKQVVLGSSSPRRKEIFDFFSIPFIQDVPNFDEESVVYKQNPIEYTKEITLGKAKALKEKYKDSILITADTMVFLDDKALGKPGNEIEMYVMLQALSGRTHSVITSLCVSENDAFYTGFEETKVTCNELDLHQIGRYIEAHHLLDKAGSYACQNSGSLLIKQIQGCYYNVMGLPINLLASLLKQVGIDIWDHLKEF